MSGKRSVRKSMKFEEAMEKMEAIVAELEGGELTLDESLARFEEGISLSRLCTRKLDEAEKRIAILVGEGEGRGEQPFDPDGGPAPDEGKA